MIRGKLQSSVTLRVPPPLIKEAFSEPFLEIVDNIIYHKGEIYGIVEIIYR